MLENSSETNGNTSNSNGSAQSVDLKTPGVAKQVAKRVLEAIDEYCQSYDDGHRKHLGASLIGDDCKRKLWYGFRWVYKRKLDSRLLRLFNRGHREEDRFIEWLEGAGFKVWCEDRSGLMYHPESDSYWLQTHPEDFGDGLSHPITETSESYAIHIGRAKLQGIKFKQYRISGVGGHFGGSLDGIAQFPASWNIPGFVLLEFKTNGTGKGFNDLVSTGMAVTKPQHFAQTSTYGADENYQFEWVLYFNINKNDDTLHVELVKLDWNLGQQMKAKAEQIIGSQTPPPRLSLDRTYWKCKGCDFASICHDHCAAEINCRSCKNAVPVDGAQWLCQHPSNAGNGPIPDEIIAKGCGLHEDITLDFND